MAAHVGPRCPLSRRCCWCHRRRSDSSTVITTTAIRVRALRRRQREHIVYSSNDRCATSPPIGHADRVPPRPRSVPRRRWVLGAPSLARDTQPAIVRGTLAVSNAIVGVGVHSLAAPHTHRSGPGAMAVRRPDAGSPSNAAAVVGGREVVSTASSTMDCVRKRNYSETGKCFYSIIFFVYRWSIMPPQPRTWVVSQWIHVRLYCYQLNS